MPKSKSILFKLTLLSLYVGIQYTPIAASAAYNMQNFAVPSFIADKNAEGNYKGADWKIEHKSGEKYGTVSGDMEGALKGKLGGPSPGFDKDVISGRFAFSIGEEYNADLDAREYADSDKRIWRDSGRFQRWNQNIGVSADFVRHFKNTPLYLPDGSIIRHMGQTQTNGQVSGQFFSISRPGVSTAFYFPLNENSNEVKIQQTKFKMNSEGKPVHNGHTVVELGTPGAPYDFSISNFPKNAAHSKMRVTVFASSATNTPDSLMIQGQLKNTSLYLHNSEATELYIEALGEKKGHTGLLEQSSTNCDGTAAAPCTTDIADMSTIYQSFNENDFIFRGSIGSLEDASQPRRLFDFIAGDNGVDLTTRNVHGKKTQADAAGAIVNFRWQGDTYEGGTHNFQFDLGNAITSGAASTGLDEEYFSLTGMLNPSSGTFDYTASGRYQPEDSAGNVTFSITGMSGMDTYTDTYTDTYMPAFSIQVQEGHSTETHDIYFNEDGKVRVIRHGTTMLDEYPYDGQPVRIGGTEGTVVSTTTEGRIFEVYDNENSELIAYYTTDGNGNYIEMAPNGTQIRTLDTTGTTSFEEGKVIKFGDTSATIQYTTTDPEPEFAAAPPTDSMADYEAVDANGNVLATYTQDENGNYIEKDANTGEVLRTFDMTGQEIKFYDSLAEYYASTDYDGSLPPIVSNLMHLIAEENGMEAGMANNLADQDGPLVEMFMNMLDKHNNQLDEDEKISGYEMAFHVRNLIQQSGDSQLEQLAQAVVGNNTRTDNALDYQKTLHDLKVAAALAEEARAKLEAMSDDELDTELSEGAQAVISGQFDDAALSSNMEKKVKAVRAEMLAEKEEALNALRTQLEAEAQTALNNLRAELGTNPDQTARITELEAQLQAANDEKSLLEGEKTDLESENQGLRTDKENLQNDNSSLQTQLDEKQGEIDAKQGEIDDLNAQLLAAGGNDDATQELVDKIADLEAEVEQLKNAPPSNQEQIDGLNEQITHLQSEIGGLEDDLESARRTSATLKTEADKIPGLQAQLLKAQNDLKTATGDDFVALKNEISELQTDLSDSLDERNRLLSEMLAMAKKHGVEEEYKEPTHQEMINEFVTNPALWRELYQAITTDKAHLNEVKKDLEHMYEPFNQQKALAELTQIRAEKQEEHDGRKQKTNQRRRFAK